MTFETAYADWLTSEITKRLKSVNDDLTIKLYNEVSYKALSDSADTIAMVVSGGNATRANVQNIDQNAMPLSVTFICRDTNRVALQNAIENFQAAFNAVPTILTYHDAESNTNKQIKTKSTFNTPSVLDERDWRAENGKAAIKATIMQMSAAVRYGTNAYVSQSAWQLIINNVSYPINYIMEANLSSAPSQDEHVGQGNDRATRNNIIRVNGYAFSILKVDGYEPLQTVLDNELVGAGDSSGGGLWGKELALRGSDGPGLNIMNVPISTYNVTRVEQGTAAVYSLTLGA